MVPTLTSNEGRTMTAVTAERAYAVAKGQLGYHETGGRHNDGNLTKYGAAYGMNAVAWCSIFVWWVFRQLGINLAKLISGAYASAEQAMEGWQRKGWKVYKTPKLMDVVFFHFEGEHDGANHTGFVVAADKGGVHTIEGNTSAGNVGSQSNGGVVAARYRPYSQIIGYGRYPWDAPAPAVPKVAPIQPGHKGVYPTLHYGMTTANAHVNDVKRLQYLLHIKVTGNFDRLTETHVKQAQFNRHLLQDGIAGPATLMQLGF